MQLSFVWSPSVLGRQTSESPQLQSPSCTPCTSYLHITPVLRNLHWLPVRARISYTSVSTSSSPPSPVICLTYICILLLDLFAPVPTPTSSKFHSISAKRKMTTLSITLVLLFRTHLHCPVAEGFKFGTTPKSYHMDDAGSSPVRAESCTGYPTAEVHIGYISSLGEGKNGSF